MAPACRPIDAPMLTQAEFLRERWRIYHNDWDIEDIETNTEGESIPYVPTKEDLDEWLAHWRAIYPEKFAAKKVNSGNAIQIRGDRVTGVKAKEAAAGKGKEVQQLPDNLPKMRVCDTDMPGTFHAEPERGVDVVEWNVHSEGLKAIEEGMGERMEHGVKALLRKLRK